MYKFDEDNNKTTDEAPVNQNTDDCGNLSSDETVVDTNSQGPAEA